MLKIRLARRGAKKKPVYGVVVASDRAPRDGKFKEKIGTYHPLLPRNHPERVKINKDRLKYWLSVGAQPTIRIQKFIKIYDLNGA